MGGKRLPTDIEWRGRRRAVPPWGVAVGRALRAAYCNGNDAGTTLVTAFRRTVGPFRGGFCVGNVQNGSTWCAATAGMSGASCAGGRYCSASHVSGRRAQPVCHHHKFLLMAPSLDRSRHHRFSCRRWAHYWPNGCIASTGENAGSELQQNDSSTKDLPWFVKGRDHRGGSFAVGLTIRAPHFSVAGETLLGSDGGGGRAAGSNQAVAVTHGSGAI